MGQLVVVGIIFLLSALPYIARALQQRSSLRTAAPYAPPRVLPHEAKLISVVRIACVLLALLGSGTLVGALTKPEATAVKEPLSGALPAIGSSTTIDISDVVPLLADMTKRDADDQLRDWAVYGLLTQSAFDADTISKARNAQPPVRLPYLEDAFAFDYGRGRRAILERGTNTTIVLIVDADDPHPKATLGRLADQVRMETTEQYPSYEVFEAAANPTEGTIALTRKASLSQAELFGPEYGYFSAHVGTLSAFKAWLETVDDLTFAKQEEDMTVTLGGRRFADARERGVSLEDVAVLYRAQAGTRTRKFAADSELATVKRDIEAEMNGRQQLSKTEGDKRYQAAARRILRGVGSEPGFSLDPHWVRTQLPQKLETLAADPCRGIVGLAVNALGRSTQPADRTAPDFQHQAALDAIALRISTSPAECTTIRGALGDRFRAMAEQIRGVPTSGKTADQVDAVDDAAAELDKLEVSDTGQETIDGFTAVAVGLLKASDKVQCARYDGPPDPDRSLQGTRVGMNLFYTDLLAKLWVSVDYHRSAPVAQVPGFLSKPRLDLEPEWGAEIERLRATRLWFGPKRESMSRDQAENRLFFPHIATRVFAAGSDGTHKANEAQPSEHSRRAYGWWDKHYEAVAAYEQEYALQNQVMKWSVLTQWLTAKGLVNFLDNEAIPVRRDLRFDTWLASEGHTLGVKYEYPVALKPAEVSVTGTECIGLIQSYSFKTAGKGLVITGGVSLGGETVARQAPHLVAEGSPALRFSNAFRSASQAEGEVGTALQMRPSYKGGGRVVADVGAETRVRWGGKSLDLGGAASAEATTSARGASVRLASNKGEIGALVMQSGEHPRLSWHAGDLHEGMRPEALADAPSLAFAEKSPLGDALAAGNDADVAKLLAGKKAPPEQLLAEARTSALDQGTQRLRAGDAAGARRLFAVARAGGDTPQLRVANALSDLEAGLLTRAKTALHDVDAAALAHESTPTLTKLRSAGLDDAAIRDVVGGGTVSREGGALSLVSEQGSARSVLRTNRPLRGRVIATAEDALKKDGVAFYVDDRFSLNRFDLEAQGEGVLGDLAHDPSVRWSEVDVPLGDYAPDLLVDQSTKVRRAVRSPANTPPKGTPIRSVVVIRRCVDPDDCRND